MAKSSVSKLVPKVPPLPSVPGMSRRQQFSASTKKTLVEVAERLFTEHGYASTSLDAIVAGAEVTKGALYHHFSGKQALYEVVFEKVEAATAQSIDAAMRESKDPWEQARAGLRTFLEAVQQPTYRRIVVQEGPAVLGYQRYREQEERSTFTVVEDIVAAVLRAGDRNVDDEMVATFARLFFGAMSAAGESVTEASDPEDAAERIELAVTYLLTGVQTLAKQGVKVEDMR
ncbi:TetR/AcrR family transcriptional regulator [Nocardioides sp. NPDC101246]|uniref:TetR/AcrR family transcriptional regulator n=1 Tax=unclassified Nocardioides TaxID=2615069 RepID=UPI00088FE840|nr:TetR/AcrR family transcriptional regulator [Nocardioides sp. YR527]SDK80104.1 transcriptional regulator, TetR family [Nocardioides sp. YR527]